MAVMYAKPANQIVPLASSTIYVCLVIKPLEAGAFVTIGWSYFEILFIY